MKKIYINACCGAIDAADSVIPAEGERRAAAAGLFRLSLGGTAGPVETAFTGSFKRKEKQEQTKFYDLRRGITEDFQRLAKFQKTSKSTKKIHRF